MARYNEILVGRYARGIQKLFGMKGEVPVASLSGELGVAHVVMSGVENRYLEGWDLFANVVTQGAVAAQFSQVQLRNPPTSNTIAVMMKLTFLTQAGNDNALLNHLSTVSDLATIVTPTNPRLDPRGRSSTALVMSRTTLAGLTGNALVQAGVTGVTGTYDFIQTDIQEIPLLPGDALVISSNTVNQGMTSSWFWRERALEESERT